MKSKRGEGRRLKRELREARETSSQRLLALENARHQLNRCKDQAYLLERELGVYRSVRVDHDYVRERLSVTFQVNRHILQSHVSRETVIQAILADAIRGMRKDYPVNIPLEKMTGRDPVPIWMIEMTREIVDLVYKSEFMRITEVIIQRINENAQQPRSTY